MSIENRIKDALYLWDDKRYEGALLSVLVAVAGTSRLRYPDRTEKDSKVFQKFFNESLSSNPGVEFRGRKISLGRLFYSWLRNMLVHKGMMPQDIKFVQDGDPHKLTIWRPKPPDSILKLSDNWFDELVKMVASAPENKETLGGLEYIKIQKIENNDKALF